MARRITIRFNDLEVAELELLKKRFHIDDDSKAVKAAIEWVNHYIENVTQTFFPPSYDLVLVKKKKNDKLGRQIY
jgi:hypothetical protein